MSAKMRVVVTGASGFIGKQFMEAFRGHAVTGLRFSRPKLGLLALDLKVPFAVRARMDAHKPEVVIHCAARPSVDWCEQNLDEARAMNFDPVVLIAEECKRLGAKFVFLSTDYVFDGTAGPYCETDATNPINVYGRLKQEGEQAIARITDNHIIVRTTNVYGFDPESKNFLMAILPQLGRGERVRVANDQFGNPTLVGDLCSITKELVVNGGTGIFHVTGPDLVSRAEWLERAARVFGLDTGLISAVPTSELDQVAPRPKKSGLVSHRLDQITSKRALGLDVGLLLMKRAWNDFDGGVSGPGGGSAGLSGATSNERTVNVQ